MDRERRSARSERTRTGVIHLGARPLDGAPLETPPPVAVLKERRGRGRPVGGSGHGRWKRGWLLSARRPPAAERRKSWN